MKNISTYLLGFSLALAAAGCSKETDPAPEVSAKVKLLTTPKWRISAVVGATNIAGQTLTFDGMTRIPSCKKDDLTKFNTDLTGVSDEAASRCASADPQTKAFTWSFGKDETTLTIVDPAPTPGSPTTATAEVLQLTSTLLQLRTTTTQVISGYTTVSTATTSYVAL